jgi:hypothetical protein
MELTPSPQATSCAAARELPSVVPNPKVHYHAQNRSLLISILRWTNLVHTIHSSLSNIHLTYYQFAYVLVFLFVSFLLAFPQLTYRIPLLVIHATWPSHLILFDLSIAIIFKEEYKLRVRFEVFTAMTMKNAVSLDVTLCSSCRNGRFVGT